MLILVVIVAILFLVIFIAHIRNNKSKQAFKPSTETFTPLKIEAHTPCVKTFDANKHKSFIYPDTKNYPCFHTYKVKGKNPATNRQKTVNIVAREGTPPDIIGAKTYLLPPYSLSIDEQPAASEAQLEYAKNLDIPIPHSPSLLDMRVLLSRRLEDFESDYISPELFILACESGTQLSAYTSTEIGICSVLGSFPDRACLSFFCYFVYCSMYGIWPITDPTYSSHKVVFESFAQEYASNPELLDTIRSMTCDHIRYIRAHNHPDKRNLKNARAFSLASDFLSSRLSQHIPSPWEKWKTLHGDFEQIKRQCRSYDKKIILLSINPAEASSIIQGTEGQYQTSLSSCTCPDFQRRQKPCKHMYRLAYELRDKAPEL